MDGGATLVLIWSAMAVFLVGVASQARVCYFGPPTESDPDNPDDWMKQVIREIRMRCPGRRQPAPAGKAGCDSPQPLGMENRSILDDQIRASSSHDILPASAARLNNDINWTPSNFTNPWIEVDLVDDAVVAGVITQGFPSGGGCVMQYKVAYKKHLLFEYEHVMDLHGNVKVFIGNNCTHSNTPVTNLFDESVVATVVRIEPTEWGRWIALRLELIGCRRD